MRTELVTIKTDTIPLEGAFYEPDEGPSRGGVLLFHGNTMNFYIGAPRFLPPMLTRMGFSCLAFNRRGHDILSIRNSRALEGAAFQTTSEGVEDNNIAAAWMAERGYPAPIVIGHSRGGMLAAVHAHGHPETPALVLLSAIGGGGDPILSQKKTGFLGGARSEDVMATAKALVADGKGDELMLVPGWWNVISAASYVDHTTNLPSILSLAAGIHAPTLYIRGDLESPDIYPAEAFAARSGAACEVMILENCDHFYNQCEDMVCERVAGWLTKTLG